MVEVEPALETEAFFETIYGLARDGKLDANNSLIPSRSRSCLLDAIVWRCTSPSLPPGSQGLAAIAAPVGRLSANDSSAAP